MRTHGFPPCRVWMLLAVCALMWASPVLAAGPGDWWMFRHDPQHTGRSPFHGPSAPSLRWKCAIGAAISSSPAIGADGTIYVGSQDNAFYAIHPADGTVKWKYATGGLITSSPAIGADGTLYIGSQDDSLYALDPATGALKWKYATNGPILSSPTIGTDGTVYVGSMDGSCYALTPTGTLKWKCTMGLIQSSPAIDADGTIYVGTENNALYALNPVNGTPKWSFTAQGYVDAAPAIGADGTVYVGSTVNSLGTPSGTFYALDPATGTVKWKYSTELVYSSAAIGTDGTVYVGSNDSRLYAFNPADGTVKWKYATSGQMHSSPAIDADGAIYVGSLDTNLYALNSDGSLRWKYATKWAINSSPVLGADGTLYIGSGDGNLYAIGRPLTLTPQAGSDGAVTPSSPQQVEYGGTRTFLAAPDAGYAVDTWTVDGTAAQSGGTTFTLANVTADHTIQVTFSPTATASCVITPGAGCNGAITPSTGNTVPYGNNLTLTATPAAGYAVNSWWVDSLPAQTGGSQLTLTNITDNHTVLVSFSATATRSNWWMFRNNPRHTGDSPYVGSASPGLKWKHATFYISSSPAIGADCTIYCGDENGDLNAYRPTDGSLKWQFWTGQYNGVDSSPAIGADGTIYVGSMSTDTNNFLYALNSDGSLKWKYQTGWIESSPTIGTDGTIYVGSNDDYLYAFNPDGTLKWKFQTGGSISTSSPAIGADGTVYISSYDHYLYALNPANGACKWKYAAADWIGASPMVGADGTIYVGSKDSYFYAINPSGTLKWKYNTGNAIASSAAIGKDGAVYVASWSGYLYAFNPADGTLKWKSSVGTWTNSSPAIGADGAIYIGSGDDNLYAFTPDGTLQWKFATGGKIDSSPAIGADGTLYVGSWDYNLYAITTGPGQFVVTAQAGINGAISPAAPQQVPYGARLFFIAMPEVNYTVDTWSLDGTAAQTGGSVFLLDNIIANHTVKVTFRYAGPIEHGEWWMFRHDPQHTGRSAVSGPATPVLQWKFGTTKDINSSAVFGADGTVYIGSEDATLYALNPVDGVVKWRYATGIGIFSTPLLSADGTIYVGSADNSLYALNAADGALKWKFTTGNAIVSSPVGDANGTIYVGSYDDSLYALSPNGTLLWKYTTGSGIGSSPALGTDGTIYFGSYDWFVYALKPDGTLKWKYNTGNGVWSSPALGADGTVYIGSNNRNLIALNPANGTPKWQFATGGQILSSPALGTDGTVYIGSMDSSLYAINPTYGTQKWKFTTGKGIDSSPALGADGMVYIGAEDSNLYALNPADGTLKWQYPLGGGCDGSPSIGADGTIYIGSADGNLYAIGHPPVPNTPPTFNPLANQTLLENAGLCTLPITGISAGDAGQTVAFTTASSNPALIPNPVVSYTNPNTTGTLTFKPVAEGSGTAVITVTAKDNGGTANGGSDTITRQFTVTVNVVNDAPTLDPLPDCTLAKSSGAQTISLTGISAGDADDAGQTLTIAAVSANTALIPNPVIGYTSPNPTGTLTLTPVANKLGTALITVTVKDSGGTVNGGVDTLVRTFTVTVSTVNDAPTIKAVANLTLNEDAAAKTISLSGIGAGKVGQVVAVTAISNNPALIPNPTVNYVSPKSTGTLTLAPAPHAFGTAVITLTVKDDGGTAFGGVDTVTRTFTVTVTAVNDAPTLDAIANLQAKDDGQTLTVPLTGIGPGGAGEESAQTVSVTATSGNTKLLPNPVVSGSGATQTLTLQPIAGKYGTVTITVTVKDNAGTAHGGKDTTRRTFTLTLLHHQPDLWVKNGSDSGFAGKAVYNTDGTKQTKTQAITAGGSATYNFAVQNAGTAPDTFTLRNAGDTTGWTVQYFTTDASGKVLAPLADDLTTGWSTGVMTAGQVCYLKAVIAGGHTPCTLQLTATSAVNPQRQDVVKMVTTVK